MDNEKLCPNCQQPVEKGAAYCGNCGQKLGQATSATVSPPVSVAPITPVNSPLSQVYNQGAAASPAAPPMTAAPAGPNLPAYAKAVPHHRQHFAAMAVIFGILGIGASLLIPILGIAFGLAGIILATTTYRYTIKWLKWTALTISALALISGIGAWVYAVAHDPKLHPAATQKSISGGVASVNVTTPCYSLSFSTELNVNNTNGSCSLSAYNGPSLADSSNVYKVVASQTNTVNVANFTSLAKTAIDADIAKNLPDFIVTSQASNQFAGSPAYYAQATNSAENIGFVEEAVMHDSITNANNFFVIVHAVNGTAANLNTVDRNWQWND